MLHKHPGSLDHVPNGTSKEDMTEDEVDTLLAKSLRDGSIALQGSISDTVADRIIERGAYHGILSLLHAKIPEGKLSPDCLYDRIHAHAMGVAMRELGERQQLARVIEAFAISGTKTFFLKGVALAYSLYTDPAIRERADVDLLIDVGQRDATHLLLVDLGWRHRPGIEIDATIGQSSYTYDGAGSLIYHIDLHWQISNSPVLAALFSFDEIEERSIALKALHPESRTPCPTDALLIACLHRLVHLRTPYYSENAARYSADRLIWLYDIHLLCQALGPNDWRAFATRAIEKGLAAACLDGLTSAKAKLGTALPEPIVGELAAAGAQREVASTYLFATWLQRETMDFQAVYGPLAKLKYLAQIAFPPADYMRARFGRTGFDWLPWLYFRRAGRGIGKRLRGRPDTFDRKTE